ncbi:MAG: hypothetical protein HYT87_11455 [Nitrospirae bacterium]|nr:hypothetical protein [Nitrospirota bacterium]
MLTQAEADLLIAMKKTFADPKPLRLTPGRKRVYELLGDDKKEQFLLDIWRASLKLSKVSFNTRGRKVVVLVRVDLDGAPHTNPDETKIGGSHIHLYREGYDDKWAYPLDQSEFRKPSSVVQTLLDFLAYCRIGGYPPVQDEN